MPLQLMKLLATATTTTTVVPASTKFFHVTPTDTAPTGTLTIAVGAFFTDTGDAATELPAIGANGFYVVYVNGVLQMGDTVAYTPGTAGTGQLVITVPDGDEGIPAGSPVVLSIEAFTPTSTTVILT